MQASVSAHASVNDRCLIKFCGGDSFSSSAGTPIWERVTERACKSMRSHARGKWGKAWQSGRRGAGGNHEKGHN